MTEEEWNAETAAEIVAVAYNPATNKPEHLVILDGGVGVAQELDKHLARAVAVRLVELAEQLPEPPRILRRDSDIDDELMGRDI